MIELVIAGLVGAALASRRTVVVTRRSRRVVHRDTKPANVVPPRAPERWRPTTWYSEQRCSMRCPCGGEDTGHMLALGMLHDCPLEVWR